MDDQTVLIIHKELWMPKLLSRALQPSGVRVLGATNGADGLALFRAHHREVGAVLVGRTLPRLSSVQLLAAMEPYCPAAPVVIITGLPPFAVRHEYAGYQIAAILQTPFELRAVCALVLTLVSCNDLCPASV